MEFMGLGAVTMPGQHDHHEEQERDDTGNDQELCKLRGHSGFLHADSAFSCERPWVKL